VPVVPARRFTSSGLSELVVTDARKDWCEKVSTGLASGFDVIRVEDLKITNMTRSVRGTVAEPGRNVKAKAGLNREILASGWDCW
jgi:putative transposase